jgi:hypothetical protein
MSEEPLKLIIDRVTHHIQRGFEQARLNVLKLVEDVVEALTQLLP